MPKVSKANRFCECVDKGCPVHQGVPECSEKARACLVRVDMEDETGTLMCQGCAEDAMDSGVFAVSVKGWIAATRRRKGKG